MTASVGTGARRDPHARPVTRGTRCRPYRRTVTPAPGGVEIAPEAPSARRAQPPVHADLPRPVRQT
ncbi:MAG: hypothetical protein OXC11_09840, partial [Rhodospirillales bacterium]|nr:hypothetical protein [Rhodospirillales bacterium]